MSKKTLKKPKFVTVNIESATGKDLGRVSYIPLPNVDYVPKQETLEEAAKGYSEIHEDVSGTLGRYLVSAVFQDGAKWQQEQDRNVYLNGYVDGSREQAKLMYSEEDMLKSFMAGIKCESNSGKNFEQFIEQFKKK